MANSLGIVLDWMLEGGGDSWEMGGDSWGLKGIFGGFPRDSWGLGKDS